MILDYLGPRIREIRKLKGYSQSKLAILAKLNSSCILDVESGKRSFSIKTLDRICTALDIDPIILFKGEEST